MIAIIKTNYLFYLAGPDSKNYISQQLLLAIGVRAHARTHTHTHTRKEINLKVWGGGLPQGNESQ